MSIKSDSVFFDNVKKIRQELRIIKEIQPQIFESFNNYNYFFYMVGIKMVLHLLENLFFPLLGKCLKLF